MRIPEQPCAYEIAIAAHLRAHVVATSGRDVTSVVSGIFLSFSCDVFAVVTESWTAATRESSGFSRRPGHGTGKVTPKFLMSLVSRISTTEKLSRGCNLEMQRSTASENDEGDLCILCALTTALLMPPRVLSERKIPGMRAFSWSFRHICFHVSPLQSRSFCMKLKDFSNVIPREVTFEKSHFLNFAKRRKQGDEIIMKVKSYVFQ